MISDNLIDKHFTKCKNILCGLVYIPFSKSAITDCPKCSVKIDDELYLKCEVKENEVVSLESIFDR